MEDNIMNSLKDLHQDCLPRKSYCLKPFPQMSSWLISQTLTIIHSHHYSCQSKHTLHTTWRALQQTQYEHVMCNGHQKQRAGWHDYCCWRSCGQWPDIPGNCPGSENDGHMIQTGSNTVAHIISSVVLTISLTTTTTTTTVSKASCTHHDHGGVDHLLNHHHYHWKENILHASFQHWTSLHKLVHAEHVCMY